MKTRIDIIIEMAKLVIYEFVKMKTPWKEQYALIDDMNLNLEYIKEKIYMKVWKIKITRKDISHTIDNDSYLRSLMNSIQTALHVKCYDEYLTNCNIKRGCSEYTRDLVRFIVLEHVSSIKETNLNELIDKIKSSYSNLIKFDDNDYDLENVDYD